MYNLQGTNNDPTEQKDCELQINIQSCMNSHISGTKLFIYSVHEVFVFVRWGSNIEKYFY